MKRESRDSIARPAEMGAKQTSLTGSAIVQNDMLEEVSKPSIKIQDDGAPKIEIVEDNLVSPEPELAAKRLTIPEKLKFHCAKHTEMNRYCKYSHPFMTHSFSIGVDCNRIFKSADYSSKKPESAKSSIHELLEKKPKQVSSARDECHLFILFISYRRNQSSEARRKRRQEEASTRTRRTIPSRQ